MSLNYELVRYSDMPRLINLDSEDGNVQIKDCNVISAHLYRGTYYAGSLPYCNDQTQCLVRYQNETLSFQLEMTDPDIADVKDKIASEDTESFWDTDFVSLNFISADNRLIQVAVKPDGTVKGFTDYENEIRFDEKCEVNCTEDKWSVELDVPLALIGFDKQLFDSCPIPFDLVRYQCANGALSSWSLVPSQLPFNELYRFPVFCFGLLTLNDASWEDYAFGSPDLGELAYDGPQEVVVGTVCPYTFTYTPGKHGLAENGAIKFNLSNEVIECNRKSPVVRRFPEKDWGKLQWDDPRKPGYIRAECSDPNVKLSFEKKEHDYFSISLRLNSGVELKSDQKITISIGTEQPMSGIRSQLLAQRNFPFKFFFDPLGNGIFHQPQTFPKVNVIGRTAQALLVHSHPTPDPDEKFRLVVTAVDYYGNIADSYEGNIVFNVPVKIDGLPDTYTFSRDDRGVAEFQVSTPDRDVFVITAVDIDSSGINGSSNLLVTDGSFGPGKIYFGDIHTHSQLSDGRLHPFDKYREIAQHRGLDFWALSDHGHDLTWARIQLLNNTLQKFNRDGSFITIPGFEWTGSMGYGKPLIRKYYGHRNIYFRNPVEKIYDGVYRASDSPEKLHSSYQKILGDEFFMVNHFHCGDPELCKGVDNGVEVSGWCGNSVRENSDKYSIEDAYQCDPTLFVTAGTDHGTEAYYTGEPAEITAVICENLTRDNVFDAFKNGATYGTSGQKVLLKFSVNGVSPGKDLHAVNATERNIEAIVGSAMPVLNVELIRNGEVIGNLGGNDFGVKTFKFTDSDPEPKQGYYYVRVKTAQGHITWSSPVGYSVK